jgi:putative transposase
MGMLTAISALLRVLFASRAGLAAENLALREQLVVLQRSVKRPRLRRLDRVFWAWLSRLWARWRSCLLIVKRETVVRWHRQGFKAFWRRKSRKGRLGRPPVEAEIRRLIRRVSRENPTWGAPRIQSELSLLGYTVAQSTVARYMDRSSKSPSQTWRTFLKDHADQIAATDFFTVRTITFRVLYCFLVARHDRRRVVHFNVTASPTAGWTAQQVVEAFPYEEAPRYILWDRDSIYGEVFRQHGD